MSRVQRQPTVRLYDRQTSRQEELAGYAVLKIFYAPYATVTGPAACPKITTLRGSDHCEDRRMTCKKLLYVFLELQ
jgi:hypothetical protein